MASGSEQSVPAPTSADQLLQEPPCYLEEEEEEIYISEAMQEITDGNFVSKALSCDFLNFGIYSMVLNCSVAPPSIQVPAEDLYVEPGQPATFTAIITGRPTPNVQWYKVGEQSSLQKGCLHFLNQVYKFHLYLCFFKYTYIYFQENLPIYCRSPYVTYEKHPLFFVQNLVYSRLGTDWVFCRPCFAFTLLFLL